MTIPTLGVLSNVQVRDAWPHEAHSFTPWLAENLQALSEVIGIPLELRGTEVRVPPFYADVLAHNPQDDSLVLIENQLEATDHAHLGAIMTYLAGLEAKTIVWIATAFNEAHLSALRWLNEHTVEPFSFFAVQGKTVRIGDSEIAPVFEVIERPNGWDDRLREIAMASRSTTELGLFRREFWSELVERFPAELAWGPASAGGNRTRDLPETGFVISMYLAQDGAGVFIRGRRGEFAEAVAERLAPHAEKLGSLLTSQTGGEHGYFFISRLKANTVDRTTWPELLDWLHTTANLYETTLREIFEGQS